MDSIVQYTNYVPATIENINTDKVKKEVYENIVQNLKNTDISTDKETAIKQVVAIGKDAAFKVIEKERLNLRYDYFYDMLIFLILSISSLLFAFLLKIEDRKKGYGLELPNIKN